VIKLVLPYLYKVVSLFFLFKKNNMEHTVLLHSILRWLLLLLFLYVVIKSFLGMRSKQRYTSQDEKASLLLLIICDVQLIIGFILYFGNHWFEKITNGNIKEVMKNGFERFFVLEHILLMLIAIILVHIGRTKIKYATTVQSRHKRAFWFFIIALLIILVSIPWPFREGMSWKGWI